MKQLLLTAAAAALIAAQPVAALAGSSSSQTAAAAAMAKTGKPIVMNALQKQADRANKDRWQRDSHTEAKPASEEEEDADADEPEAKQDRHERPAHPGELNGKLHLGEW